MITGAGGGIGYACARAFAAQGADLILSDIDGPALERAASNFGALGRFCDVASEASVAVFTAEVLKSHTSIDVLINAAGEGYVRNLGTMRITRAFLPMMKSDGGKKDIVNIASMGGTRRARRLLFPLCGFAGGVRSLVRSACRKRPRDQGGADHHRPRVQRRAWRDAANRSTDPR